MKPIKMFGLVALAALLAMAFVGASSAMAESTELCETDPGTGTAESCPFGSRIDSVHETSVGKAKLLASPRVECNVLFSSTSVGEGASPQVIEGHFTYTNCGCTVEEEPGTTASLSVLKLGHETADVTGNARIIVICFGIECTYNGTNLVGTAKGPLLSTEANGEVNLSEQEVSGSGTFCPSRGKLDIKTTPLSATRIAGAGNDLMACIEVPKGTGLYKNEGINGVCDVNSMTGTNTRDGNFELALIRPDISVGSMVCGRLVAPTRGLYLATNASGMECVPGSRDMTRVGVFELGSVKNVK